MQLTANLVAIVVILGLAGFAVFYLIRLGRDLERLKRAEKDRNAIDAATVEILKERDPGETENDLEKGAF